MERTLEIFDAVRSPFPQTKPFPCPHVANEASVEAPPHGEGRWERAERRRQEAVDGARCGGASPSAVGEQKPRACEVPGAPPASRSRACEVPGAPSNPREVSLGPFRGARKVPTEHQMGNAVLAALQATAAPVCETAIGSRTPSAGTTWRVPT
ncbi:hypothetical protein ACFOLD_13785 [Kocuria carniphila]|uniref:hypothetical protein n=1 Tax=Kocuria carniphila TaxID=262208 RepID=UPI003613636A